MALRHAYPGGSDGLVPRAELRVAARTRAPTVVEFRRGADMRSVVADMGDRQSVLLDAAVGAGKSTEFPKNYAKYAKSLTFHVTPNPLLALELYNYVAKKSVDEITCPLSLMRSPDDPVPKTGLVFMSSAVLVGVMVKFGELNRFGDVTVFLDEAHESDAYTHVVRNLSINMGAMRLIQASATHAPSGSRARETPGEVRSRVFSSAESPMDWDVLDPSKPWAAHRLTGNLLVFNDSHKQAKRLVEQYNAAGIDAYRLESKMSEDRYMKASMALRDTRGFLVAIVADSSFRSGFTYDVAKTIDCGQVAYQDPTPGVVRKAYKLATCNDTIQASGRGGRLSSGTVEYWVPDVAFPKVICDLEAVEKEAAAYLYRCLGFSPIGDLGDAMMARETLPENVDVASALNSCYPLTAHLVDESGKLKKTAPPAKLWREPVKLSLAEVEPPVSRRGSSASAGIRVSVDSQSTTVVGSVVGSPAFEKVDPVDKMSFGASDEALEMFKKLMAHEPAELVAGEYYQVLELSEKAANMSSWVFPQGLSSVRRMLAESDGDLLVAGLPKQDRKAALAWVVNRYNDLNVAIHATQGFYKSVAQAAGSSPSYDQRKYLVMTMEAIGKDATERSELLSCLRMLARRHYTVSRVEAPCEAVEFRKAALWDDYLSISAKRKVSADQHVKSIGSRDRARIGHHRATTTTVWEVVPKHVSEYRSDGSEEVRCRARFKGKPLTVLSSKHSTGTVATIERDVAGDMCFVVRK